MGDQYERRGRKNSAFQDSLTCINYGFPYRAHSCGECRLIDFVAPVDRVKEIPCQHIPLNASGETIEELEAEENQHKLEEEVKQWFRAKIEELQEKLQSESSQNQETLPPSAESSYCCKT